MAKLFSTHSKSHPLQGIKTHRGTAAPSRPVYAYTQWPGQSHSATLHAIAPAPQHTRLDGAAEIMRDLFLVVDGLIDEIKRGYQADRHAHFIAKNNEGLPIGTNWIYGLNSKNKIAYTTTFVAPEYRKDHFYGIEMFSIACDYMFNKLNCRKVYSEVHSDNIDSRLIFEKIRIPLEANFKDHTEISENKYSDLLVFALYKEEFIKSYFIKKLLPSK